jgi:hypothetical protein
MREVITLEVASRLFAEARDFASGRAPYLSEDSEIRKIAVTVFHKAHVLHLTKVCDEIFYVLACEFMDVPA